MPGRLDSDTHRQCAKDNEEFGRNRLDANYPADRPWIVTAYFYAAVHWIEAYLAIRGIDPRTHAARKRAIRRDPVLRHIQVEYRALEDRSRDARYEFATFSEADVEVIYQDLLVPLRTYMEALLPP